MKQRNPRGPVWAASVPGTIKSIFLGMMLVLTAQALFGQSAEGDPQGISTDWTHRHVLYPDSNDNSVTERNRRDPRWISNWYFRHHESWWPQHRRLRRVSPDASERDWSVALGTPSFQPLFDGSFTFTINAQTGSGKVVATSQGAGSYLATLGSLTVTGVNDIGAYVLVAGGPGTATSPLGVFNYDNVLFPATNPVMDGQGLLFNNSSGFEINLWGNSMNNYEYDDHAATGGYLHDQTGSPFTLNMSTAPDPGAGQTSPAKYVFDITAAPSCANDFVVMGLPAIPVSAGQANLLGLNNLYSNAGGTGFCPTAGPSVKFAYAAGTGQIPASVVLSTNGLQVAFIENLPTSSYFHVLTIGTTGTNGTSATASVVPGTGNNAVDQRVLLSPDGGVTTQSSTTSVFVFYGTNIAYATTYSTSGAGSGFLYKIGNVFNGSAPTILWSVPITAVPSTPVYDSVSQRIFFTDSKGRIDYVADTGGTPTVVYSATLANGSTSENPVIVDSTNQKVYASFNSNGTNAIIVQAPTSMASTVSVAVGTANTTFTAPYEPDFNNAWYTGTGTPLMYVAGTGTGTLPTLYSVGFNGTGVMNSTASGTTAALATGAADSSPVTEFFNPATSKDYLYVGVSNHCVATTGGGAAGCIMRLDITGGFPVVSAATTALAAAGGTSGIIVDNDSASAQAASVYYATKTGATLVKATQAGLN
jgi:hypothetical protein